MNPSCLSVANVCFDYGRDNWRLRDISLDVAPGEIIGVIGPNGSGKSTILKIAAGIVPCRDGTVTLDGKNIRCLGRRAIARQLGYLPQNVISTFDYRVEEVVAMGRFCHLGGVGFLSDTDVEFVDQCLRQTETYDYRDRLLSQLSGGERQRVLLASVLAQEPRILLLDEPTTGLDIHHQVTFFCLLAELARKEMAVVVVTHDLNLTAQFCHRLLLMRDGQTVKEGTVAEVVRQDVLSEIYRRSVHVDRHPVTGKPIVLPLPDPTDNPASKPAREGGRRWQDR